jgi:hypothetical protein
MGLLGHPDQVREDANTVPALLIRHGGILAMVIGKPW